MSKINRSLGALAAIALATMGVTTGSALAATHPTVKTKAQWRAAISQVRQPGAGCFRAAYPVLKWHAVKCVTAPRIPLVPRPSSRSARHAAPQTVGDGLDYSAVVSGKISKAVGTFTGVSSSITETGQNGGSGGQVANAFSLQLNTQFISGDPACNRAATPSSCQAWQQFVYTFNSRTTGEIFMQYWLINFDRTCPSGWFTFSTDCFTNSNATTVSTVTAAQLASVSLTGSAVSGGLDSVALAIGTGHATSVTNSDSKIDVATFWNTTEFGVYGDGGGSAANFGANTTLSAQTVITATSTAAPSCVQEGFTGETNNLKLTTTPALGTEALPTMSAKQTNGTSGTATCAVAG
ncbi:MAG TPA: hypothetical protein VFQ44_06540 [Streptosporangiaceae bacterium]|nr:hypothetical protein [Streptosporangiaceae bacterium]